MDGEISKDRADIAIEMSEIQQQTVDLALKNNPNGEPPALAETLRKRDRIVLEFRKFFRETLVALATKGGASLKVLGMKGIHLCQEKIKGTGDALLENELAHAFYEEHLRLFCTFFGNVSKDLYKANRGNIDLLKKLITEEAVKSGLFFKGVGSQIASIEYQEKVEELLKRIEEIYQKVLVNYKQEFIPESRAIIEDGLRAAGIGARKAKALAKIILIRLRKEQLQANPAPVQKDSL